MTVEPLTSLPIPDLLATSIRMMAPAYLRRRLSIVGTPYRDGDTVTFVYVGAADSVRIATFMSLFPQIPELDRFPNTDVWTVTVSLPACSRIEYKIEVTHEDRTEAILDPLNPERALDPYGANSVAHGPGYTSPSWADGAPLRPDAIDRLEVASRVFARTCTVGLWSPPATASTSHATSSDAPLVVIHDASDLVTFANLRTALDGLVLGGHVGPFFAVFLDPVHRDTEYAASMDHATFVLDEVLPEVRSARDLQASDRLVLAGASLGGVASLATAWHHPTVVTDLILLSGSFVTAEGGPWNRGPLFAPVIAFMKNLARSEVKAADRIWMACGAYEGLAADNRALVPVLESLGSDVSYSEPPDGHHWVSWRNSLGEALIDLIGPP